MSSIDLSSDLSEVGATFRKYMTSHRDYSKVRSKYLHMHEHILMIYQKIMLPFAVSARLEPLQKFSQLQIDWLKAVGWPPGEVYNNEMMLTFKQELTTLHKTTMDTTFTTLMDSVAIAFVMRILSGLDSFKEDVALPILDEAGVKIKYMYKEKPLGLDLMDNVSEQILTSVNFTQIFQMTLDLSGVRNPADAKKFAAAVEGLQGIQLDNYFVSQNDEGYMLGKMIVMRWVRRMIIDAMNIISIICEPDLSMGMMTELVSKLFENEDPSFRRKYAKPFSMIEKSGDLLHENFNRYYETFVMTGDPMSMSMTYIADVAKSLGQESQDSKMLQELVQHFVDRVKNKLRDAGGSPQNQQLAKTVASLQGLITKVSSGSTGMKTSGAKNADIIAAIRRNGRQ